MVEVRISADMRSEKTKHYIHKLRHKGRIPAVIYGKGINSQAIELDARELESAIRTKGRNALIDLVIKGKINENKHVVMIKEIQREAVRGNLVHADLCKVSLEDKIHTSVPVVLRGEAPGVRSGGVIQTGLREVDIECLPANIPETIHLDISGLDIGDHISVADIPDSPDYMVLNDTEAVLITIIAPRRADETTETEGPVVVPAQPARHEEKAENEVEKGE